MKKSTTKTGFTIIEFSIATAFIALLLIAISIITSSVVTIYQKGLALKAVNSVGRGLVEEFTNSINAAPSVNTTSLCRSHISAENDGQYVAACESDNASKFVFQHKIISRDAPGGEGVSEVQAGGIFCTGNYSYIWNTYYGLENASTALKLRYNYRDSSDEVQTAELSNFRLARFKDSNYRACSSVVNVHYESGINTADTIDITTLANGGVNVIDEPEQGFLSSFDLDLLIYELTIFPISQDAVTLRSFVSGTFILATSRGNVNITRSGDYCDVRNLGDDETTTVLLDMGSEYTYCAINKFNFAARTAGM